jgi:hypothetical protein
VTPAPAFQDIAGAQGVLFMHPDDAWKSFAHSVGMITGAISQAAGERLNSFSFASVSRWALTTGFWELLMTEIITAEAISRRKALTLLGLATAAFAASSVVAAPDAEAQTVGMERRQGRRTGRASDQAH